MINSKIFENRGSQTIPEDSTIINLEEEEGEISKSRIHRIKNSSIKQSTIYYNKCNQKLRKEMKIPKKKKKKVNNSSHNLKKCSMSKKKIRPKRNRATKKLKNLEAAIKKRSKPIEIQLINKTLEAFPADILPDKIMNPSNTPWVTLSGNHVTIVKPTIKLNEKVDLGDLVSPGRICKGFFMESDLIKEPHNQITLFERIQNDNSDLQIKREV